MEKIIREVLEIIVVTIIISMVIYLVLDNNPTHTSREIEVLMSFISIAIVAIAIVFIFRFDLIVARFFKK